MRIASLLFLLLSPISYAAEVNVYAAASLTDVLTELSAKYQQAHAGVLIKKSFAGSSVLAKQIEQGAPADIFISADNDWENYLFTRGLLDDNSRKKLLANELVIISPKEREVKVFLDTSFNLAQGFSGRLCTGDTTSVPAGKYAKQALLYFGWWDGISSRVVGAEDVRTALAFVERGECELGIVYKTDTQRSKKVKVVAIFPAASHTPIEYPGALTKNASIEAKAFWRFLQSDQAKPVFERYGFKTLN